MGALRGSGRDGGTDGLGSDGGGEMGRAWIELGEDRREGEWGEEGWGDAKPALR